MKVPDEGIVRTGDECTSALALHAPSLDDNAHVTCALQIRDNDDREMRTLRMSKSFILIPPVSSMVLHGMVLVSSHRRMSSRTHRSRRL